MGIMQFIGDNAVTIFKGVMDEIRLSPEKKADMEMQLAQLEEASKKSDQDLEAKLNDIAGQNIRTETSSTDGFVRRARPFFMWSMGGALSLNIIIPLLNHFFGGTMPPLVIPDRLYELFGACMLGYSALRTAEKFGGKA